VHWVIEGVASLVIVVLNARTATVTEISANDALEAPSKLTPPTAFVIRNGEEVDIASREVVRGDIVLMNTGGIVPAVCRLFESSEFKVNEMPLTGEPEDVSKKTKIKKEKPRSWLLTTCQTPVLFIPPVRTLQKAYRAPGSESTTHKLIIYDPSRLLPARNNKTELDFALPFTW
jgi:magnesium-transporting ATPase (P-type)